MEHSVVRGTCEKGLQGGAAGSGGGGLLDDRGCPIDSPECFWSHPSAGITVDAGVIDVQVTGLVGSAWLTLRALCRDYGISWMPLKS